jgi:hypothetical protein
MLNLSLTIDQVELILAILAKAPYETSAGIIEEIRNQAIPQLPPKEVIVEE